MRTADGAFISADNVIVTLTHQLFTGNATSQTHLQQSAAKQLPAIRWACLCCFLGPGSAIQTLPITIWMENGMICCMISLKILAKIFHYICIAQIATDARFAPEGCDSFYVSAQSQNLQGDVDWQTRAAPARRITALEKSIMPDLRKVITEDFYMTPEDFKADYRSEHGAGFSISLTQSAWFRYHT